MREDKLNMKIDNRLYQGDNLEVMKQIPDGTFDFIYADPPFFTGRDHNANGSYALTAKFSDRWNGIESYLEWLMPRLRQMRELLTKSGSLFVHLDWHAAHYVKVELDKIFGMDCFQNELIWQYETGGASKRRFSRKHDNILWYTRSSFEWKYYGERITIPRTEKAMHRARNPKGARILLQNSSKNPNDVLAIPQMNPMALERTGYPTQKPETLLQMLLLATTDVGDKTADFFCGSGTTLICAQRLNRKWVGCDQSAEAIMTTERRLRSLRLEHDPAEYDLIKL